MASNSLTCPAGCVMVPVPERDQDGREGVKFSC